MKAEESNPAESTPFVQQSINLPLTQEELLILASLLEASSDMLMESYKDAQKGGTAEEVNLMLDIMAIQQAIVYKVDQLIEPEDGDTEETGISGSNIL